MWTSLVYSKFNILLSTVICMVKRVSTIIMDCLLQYKLPIVSDYYRISSNLSDTSNYPDTILGNFRCSNTTDTPDFNITFVLNILTIP